MHSFDLVTVGNVIVDIFLNVSDAGKHLKINEKNELILELGDKIHLEKYNFSLGGDASNVAIGASRLGLNSCLIAETGYDEFLGKIQKTLEKEGVDTSRLTRGEVAESAFSVILNFKGDRVIFAEDRIREHNFDFQNLSTRVVYLTSLGREWQKAYEKALKFAQENQTIFVLNPGMYQIENIKLLDVILKRCDLIFLNSQEAQTILNQTNTDLKKLAFQIKELGPKEVVITDGENGACFLDKNSAFYKSPMIQGEVVERTGAGDAFASGFVSAVFYGKTPEERLFWGSLNAASAISKLGAIEGLLTKEEMEEKEKEFANFRVEKL
ncbi:MAG: carbohydrate kinase family protein [Patescibacteria group bacterium]